MADPFCGHVEGRIGCASYRVFLSRNYPMVVRNGHRRALRTSLQSGDLSCEGRSEIGRRTLRDSEWDHHRRIDWPLHSHLGGQNDLTRRCSRRPHCEAASASLPRHPAVAYLFLVRCFLNGGLICMALIKCPECQNAVSTTASTCPKCGAPIKKKSQFSALRIFLMLLGILGLFLSFANGWMFGIIASAIFILLAVIAK